MGQEIEHIQFSQDDFDRFLGRLREETDLLYSLEKGWRFSGKGPVAGFEIEAWLVDQDMRPAPCNDRFLQRLADPLASPELAKFNIELNNFPRDLRGDALSRLHHELEAIWRKAQQTAQSMGLRLLMIGILPTLRQTDLTLKNMSQLNRYQALNEQILRLRGEPLHLEITGKEHLECFHDDVMLEAAATSFQIHLQTPQDQFVPLFNASIMASAATLAGGTNAPYLFGKDLWAETRIPLFEQSIEIGGYGAAIHGPLRRVGFGNRYLTQGVSDAFRENLEHFPTLLPILFEDPPEKLSHLRLHNGTIWRWNRPLVGFDEDGTPHLRIEHRVLPAGPTIVDMIANAAFYYGLAYSLSREEKQLPFSLARDNFYLAAMHGWDAHVIWFENTRWPLRKLLLDELIPRAREGLAQLAICRRDQERYLGVIRERIAADQCGSQWQRRFIATHGKDFIALTHTYWQHQQQGKPVHTWPL